MLQSRLVTVLRIAAVFLLSATGCQSAKKGKITSDDSRVGDESPPREDSELFETAPELISMDAPEYPSLAREAGVEGEVIVRALVGIDGRVHHTVVVQSVRGLDEAAIKAVQSARFTPATQKGKPVALWMLIPLEFSLP